jgi:hypothetical protein
MLQSTSSSELAGVGEAMAEEQPFEPPDGSPPFVVAGVIDRIDWVRPGKFEVIDYKTGRIGSQSDVDQSLQLSLYALACRDALGMGTPKRVTLYFTESATRQSTTRTDEQLDAVRDDVLERVARMRTATSQRRRRPRCAAIATTGRCAQSGRDEYPGSYRPRSFKPPVIHSDLLGLAWLVPRSGSPPELACPRAWGVVGGFDTNRRTSELGAVAAGLNGTSGQA